MRKLLMKSLVGSGLVLSTLTLGGPAYSQQYQPRNDYNRSERTEQRNAFLNRVRADLDSAQAHTVPFSGDRWKIARAKESVGEFQRDMNSGNYDRQALDRAISAMQRVVDSNRLPYRWQQNLNEDVNRLRNMQNRLEGGL